MTISSAIPAKPSILVSTFQQQPTAHSLRLVYLTNVELNAFDFVGSNTQLSIIGAASIEPTTDCAYCAISINQCVGSQMLKFRLAGESLGSGQCRRATSVFLGDMK